MRPESTRLGRLRVWVKHALRDFVLVRSTRETVPEPEDVKRFLLKWEFKRVFSHTYTHGLFNDECPACLAAFEPDSRIAVFPCRHAMCLSCASSWLERSNECAICRQPALHGVV